MADPLTSLSAALADHYRIISELGHGGMASVYLAEDLKHHRRVAVKVLVPELAAALGPERFLREIEIAARLDHPHILPLYDSGEAGGFLYYVMPFVEGGTLRDRLQAERQLPIEDALQIAREVADALSYAHSRNVVHRDIKPENILLAGGHARVADFGIARAISAAGGNRLTQTGVAIGTVPYMSPEQAAGSVDLDGRSDLYSLGCVLYEMLAGDVPFVGPPESIIHQHLIADPPPITSRRPAVPPTVAAAIMRALAKTPADRFSPAAQFADALRPVERTAAAPPAAEPRSHLTTSPLSAGGAFAGISALVLAVVYLLVLQAGLPMWVFGGAVALLLIGLPIIVAAAVGERRRLTGAAPGFLTWRRALLGGGLAFSALAVVTLGYVLSRALGIGPAASLISKGTMASRQRVILADFDNRTSDSSRGPTVTELMRVGLSRSTVISLVDPDQVGRILDMMQRSLAQGLPGPVALEAAARDGIKGVITGEIAPVGSGLSITAQLLAQDGTVLLAESENIKDPNDLVAGVDRLSGRIREKFGESLRNIRANQPLDRVTTGSMKALRAFSLGLQAINQGDATRGMRLMDEAIADDSSFAMAYRKLAVSLRNAGEQRARSIWAAQQAYEHRDHLTDRERYLVVAAYHMIVTGDRDEQIANYRNVLDRYPDDVYSLTNMGVIYSELRDFARAAEYATRAIDVDSTQPESFENLVEALGRRSQFDSAQKVAERFQHRFPTNPDVKLSFLINEAMRRDYDSAAVLVDGLMKDQRGTVYWEALAYEWWGHLDLLRGQVAAARQEFKEAFWLTSKRGLEGTYLERTARRAMSERLLLDDPGVGQQLIDDALRQYPLANVRPLDRPYGILAMAMAASGQVAHAKSLMAEYQRTPDADHGQVAERWAHGARGVIALDEAKPDSAIAEFRRFDDGNACATCAWPWLAIAYDRTGVPDSVIALYERFVNLPSADVWYDDAHLAQAYERLGELYEQRGEPAKAAESYGRLLKLLHSADAVLQARVQEAEKAMARLAREGQTRG